MQSKSCGASKQRFYELTSRCARRSGASSKAMPGQISKHMRIEAGIPLRVRTVRGEVDNDVIPVLAAGRI
jgi:hypothetical protein